LVRGSDIPKLRFSYSEVDFDRPSDPTEQSLAYAPEGAALVDEAFALP
jgi:hypothetical protein